MTFQNQRFRHIQDLLLQQLVFPSNNGSSGDSGDSDDRCEQRTDTDQVGDIKKEDKDEEFLIDKAFFGSYIGDADDDDDVSKGDDDQYYNQWYLHEDGEDFLFIPVLFEDGMNFDECELYYVSLEEEHQHSKYKSLSAIARRNLPTSFRSTLPLRPLEEEEADNLPSCLRSSKKINSNVDKAEKQMSNGKTQQQQSVMRQQRRRSFGGAQTLPELPQFFRAHSCPDFSLLTSPLLHPQVNFDTDVTVVTVYAAGDYPRKIRSNLWLTKKEITRFKRQAKKEKRKRRRQKYQNYSSDDGSSGSDWSE
jgi:hypothetical protein